ncbi:hypothetical protein C8034_v004549 [Colletotrichum sidae]|uniref:Uncharacterized protein n=1 Tax=Colletotrichum sidae TaxID=1347389 RepID=A0A4R8T836_9PEZI|nr:hypothetical protein C8034_v004549 [Colletotrichum sidae]
MDIRTTLDARVELVVVEPRCAKSPRVRFQEDGNTTSPVQDEAYNNAGKSRRLGQSTERRERLRLLERGIFMAGITLGLPRALASGDGLFLTRPTHPIARQTSESSRNLCVPQRHVAETSRRNVRTTTNPSNVAQRHPHRGKIGTLREAAPPSMYERVPPPCPGKRIPCNTRDVMPRSLPGRDFMHRTRVFPARESGKGEGERHGNPKSVGPRRVRRFSTVSPD